MTSRASAPLILLADLSSRHRPVRAIAWHVALCHSCRVPYPCEVVRAIREGLVDEQ